MSRKEKAEPRVDIYARITERIVAQLEEGVRPWVQPWSGGNAAGRITRPLRHNGEPYSGMNVLLLWSESMARGYTAPIWMTFRQAGELGAHVRKGETSTTVIYASRFTRTETDARGDEVERDIPFLRAYGVFNVEQIEGLPEHYYHRPEPIRDPLERIEEADRFFANTGAVIRHGGTKAFYAPATDHIQMPPFETFRDAGSYVAVLSHESVHYAGSGIMPTSQALCCNCRP
jgi:antirestriction protein ArdC